MSEPKRDWMYNLLPRIYRINDIEEGEPLRALLRVIEDEALDLERDIDGLYNDWFIETCSQWVIPYIGDLIGVKGIQPISSEAWSLRSYIANTIGHRRQKGTALVLEKVPRDITGWPCHVTEFFKVIGTTQHMGHLRPDNLQSPNLRNRDQMDRLSGPFVEASHTIDIKPAGIAGAAYNIRNIGIFLWRLQSYPVSGVNARKVSGGYTFDPSGLDTPLFNRPQMAGDGHQSMWESDLPCPLRRHPLKDEIETIRRGRHSKTSYFGSEPVFRIDLISDVGGRVPISPRDILICDLSRWQAPSEGLDFKAAVDPEIGRLMLSGDLSPGVKEVLVSYSYGFSADVGAGPYDRQGHVRKAIWHDVDWQAGVTMDGGVADDDFIFASVSEALREWENTLQEREGPSSRVGMICIMDSRTYEEDLIVRVPEGSQLLIVAANWPVGVNGREKGVFSARMRRPCLRGSINVIGTAARDRSNPGELVIDGLMVDGWLTVHGGNLGDLRIAHSTIVPGRGGIRVQSVGNRAHASLRVVLEKTICGDVLLSGGVPCLTLTDCIMQPWTGESAIEAGRAYLKVERSTILGRTSCGVLEASSSIFADEILVERQQEGCIRFSYLPAGERMLRSFRCQPGTASSLSGRDSSGLIRGPAKGAVQPGLRPAFTSVRYGDPGYAQLSQGCAKEIMTGAENGSEMGVFNMLQQPQREANLHAVLDEYLPFGLTAEIFFVT